MNYWIDCLHHDRAQAKQCAINARERMAWGEGWEESAEFWWRMWSSYMRQARAAKRAILRRM